MNLDPNLSIGLMRTRLKPSSRSVKLKDAGSCAPLPSLDEPTAILQPPSDYIKAGYSELMVRMIEAR
jgi:hypothetical protein